ncbi:hypothetical protein Tco_1200575 [Tanacetum coccineum]
MGTHGHRSLLLMKVVARLLLKDQYQIRLLPLIEQRVRDIPKKVGRDPYSISEAVIKSLCSREQADSKSVGKNNNAGCVSNDSYLHDMNCSGSGSDDDSNLSLDLDSHGYRHGHDHGHIPVDDSDEIFMGRGWAC